MTKALARMILDHQIALRGPNESYSAVITRLAKREE
jgi:hypothetical protein